MTPDFSALEARLASLAPAPAALNRDRLMYDAGWAAAETALREKLAPSPFAPLAWVWPSIAAALTLALALSLAWHKLPGEPPAPPLAAPHLPVERRTHERRETQEPPDLPVAPPAPREVPPFVEPLRHEPASPRTGHDYLALRERVLRDGVAALDSYVASAPSPARPAASYQLLLDELLPN